MVFQYFYPTKIYVANSVWLAWSFQKSRSRSTCTLHWHGSTELDDSMASWDGCCGSCSEIVGGWWKAYESSVQGHRWDTSAWNSPSTSTLCSSVSLRGGVPGTFFQRCTTGRWHSKLGREASSNDYIHRDSPFCRHPVQCWARRSDQWCFTAQMAGICNDGGDRSLLAGSTL